MPNDAGAADPGCRCVGHHREGPAALACLRRSVQPRSRRRRVGRQWEFDRVFERSSGSGRGRSRAVDRMNPDRRCALGSRQADESPHLAKCVRRCGGSPSYAIGFRIKWRCSSGSRCSILNGASSGPHPFALAELPRRSGERGRRPGTPRPEWRRAELRVDERRRSERARLRGAVRDRLE
jgi:hypothetical protein